jgi:hypothetical protein
MFWTKQKTNVATIIMPKPPIDVNKPSVVKTATFAMG